MSISHFVPNIHWDKGYNLLDPLKLEHIHGLFISILVKITFNKVYNLTLKLSKHCTNVQNEYCLTQMPF